MPTPRRSYTIGSSTLSIEFGDITTSRADVIVSSDDSDLSMGGGVSAAILRAAGQSLLLEAAKHIPVQLGDVVVTSAGSLPAKHVFHAITIGDSDSAGKAIAAATTARALSLVRSLGLKSIAFPAIGAGVARFALEDVAVEMTEAIVADLSSHSGPLAVTLFLFDRFGRMEPIDFLTFFEQIAVRTAGLKHLPAAATRANGIPVQSSIKTKDGNAHSEALGKLGDIDRERGQIEARLAQYGSNLASGENDRMLERLAQIQTQRIALLSDVNSRHRKSVSVFVSYSHLDEDMRRELGKHLSVLEKQDIIESWHDRKITAGSEWEGDIHTALESARVILLLISADFVQSKYCYDVEMSRALQRHEAREALVIPVILRAVSLTGTPFAKLQALPRDAKPIATWGDRDSAFVDVTEGLRVAIQDLRAAP